MLQGRKLFKISLMCVILIALSAYGPWDFLGVYNKAEAAQSFLETGQKVTAFGTVIQKEIKSDYYLYSVDDATVYTNTGKLHKTSFIFKTDSNSIPINSKLNISGFSSINPTFPKNDIFADYIIYNPDNGNGTLDLSLVKDIRDEIPIEPNFDFS